MAEPAVTASGNLNFLASLTFNRSATTLQRNSISNNTSYELRWRTTVQHGPDVTVCRAVTPACLLLLYCHLSLGARFQACSSNITAAHARLLGKIILPSPPAICSATATTQQATLAVGACVITPVRTSTASGPLIRTFSSLWS
eukprot:GHUV01022367.1.p1 GENE.GHUV01022367.1~~GHUV01022367.1.p1  ORF type:complete len:143 (+),score=21.93 GHUV01022367.1:350-778(+)